MIGDFEIDAANGLNTALVCFHDLTDGYSSHNTLPQNLCGG